METVSCDQFKGNSSSSRLCCMDILPSSRVASPLCFSNYRGVLALVFMCLCSSVWRKTRRKADSISIFFLCGFEETNWGRNFSVGNQTWIGTGHCNVVVAGQPMYGIKSDDRNELFKRILMWNTWPSVLYNDTIILNRLFLKLHFPSF